MDNYQNYKNPNLNFNVNPRTKLLIGLGVVLFLIIIFWSRMTITIGAGQAGVLFRTFGNGVQTDRTYDEGFHFLAPWNKMIIYEVRQQEVFEKMSVLSSNGLEITLEISTWYRPIYDKLALLHKEKGEAYVDRVIKPALRSATREVVGRYTPEQIYSTKREAVQQEIFEVLSEFLQVQFVGIIEVLVRDITLPPTIKTAIEKKLKQEQESLEYEFRLEKARKEAQRQKIDAEGKANANRILNASLSDKILKEKGIEATLKLSESPNSKVIIIGGGKGGGLPIILNSGDK